jgi:hypothetical protein
VREHREWIGGRVTTLLAAFYQDKTDELVAEAALADWMDVLEDLPQWAIQKACIWWLKVGPRSERGRPVRPTPQDIYVKARQIAYPAPKAVPQLPAPDLSRKRVSKEVFDAAIREAGLGQSTAFKRMPKSGAE